MPIRAISKAASRGSIAELCELRKRHNWIAIPIHLITKPCNNQVMETSLKLSVTNGHYGVAEFLVGELKYQIYPEWKKSMEKFPPFSWSSLNFNQILPDLVVQSPEMEVIRDISNQIPITNVIEYLIDPANDEPCQWLDFILNSIMTSSVSRTDRIVAFELVGVAFIFKQGNCVWRGVQCWEQAMALRYSTAGDYLPIPIVPDKATSIFADGIKVIASQISLQKFKIEWNFGYRILLAQAHALSVCQRIVSQSVGRQTAAPNSFHLENLMRYANRCYNEEQQIDRSLSIALVILNQTGEFNSNSSPNCVRIFVKTLDLLIDCLKQEQGITEMEELSLTNPLVVVKFGLAILQNVMLLSPIIRATTDYWHLNILKKIHRLILGHLLRCPSQAEMQRLMECLSPYFRANNSNRFTSLLHRAIKGTDEIKMYPDQIVNIIQLFLDAGADPTAADSNGKAPFQILAKNGDWYRFDPESYKQVFETLLDAGCYHHQSNSVWKTFLSVLADQKTKYISKFSFHHYLAPLLNVVLPLSCVCAKVIRLHQISFKDKLPSSLRAFVSRHSVMKDCIHLSSLPVKN